MAHEVFISHATADKEAAEAICRALERDGIRCWIAPRDIRPGREWGEAILEAVKASRVLLLVFSKRSNNSVHVKREVSCAVGSNVALLPVRIEAVQPTGTMEYLLHTSQWLDALGPGRGRHADDVLAAVRALVDRTDPWPSPPRDDGEEHETWAGDGAASSGGAATQSVGPESGDDYPSKPASASAGGAATAAAWTNSQPVAGAAITWAGVGQMIGQTEAIRVAGLVLAWLAAGLLIGGAAGVAMGCVPQRRSLVASLERDVRRAYASDDSRFRDMDLRQAVDRLAGERPVLLALAATAIGGWGVLGAAAGALAEGRARRRQRTGPADPAPPPLRRMLLVAGGAALASASWAGAAVGLGLQAGSTGGDVAVVGLLSLGLGFLAAWACGSPPLGRLLVAVAGGAIAGVVAYIVICIGEKPAVGMAVTWMILLGAGWPLYALLTRRRHRWT